jgi:hypothetical protein
MSQDNYLLQLQAMIIFVTMFAIDEGFWIF